MLEGSGRLVVKTHESPTPIPKCSILAACSGQVLDLDHLKIYGQEGTDCPFCCRYHGEGLPAKGVLPTEFEHAE